MKNKAECIWGAGIVIAAAAAIVGGCSSSKTETASGDPKGAVVAMEGPAELSGAQLWAQTCAMCHNSVSPATYSDAQWDVVASHMRMQARLTGQEERKIRQFLQASN